MKLSVVIPVYNAARYLRSCLDSVMAAASFLPPGEVEVICVDDGSTDGSAALLAAYAKDRGCLHVHRQANAGPGVARNLGIDVARGDYLVFLDSDDCLAPDGTLARLVGLAERDRCDVLCASACTMSEAGVTGGRIPWLLRGEMLPAERPFAGAALGDLLFFAVGPVPWAKVYRRAFVQASRLRFLALKRSEDFPFVQGALAWATRIVVDDGVLVRHRTGVAASLESTKDETPCIFWEAERAFLADLAERGASPATVRAAKLRAVHRLAYNLRAMRSREGFAAVFARLPEIMSVLRTEGPDAPIADLAASRRYVADVASAASAADCWARRSQPKPTPQPHAANWYNTGSMKISVIIPVYNVEDYLRPCLDSVVGQTLRNIEIICVDDGSTDGSPEILREYAARDSRVRVITRAHTNAGAARNAGMAVASGDYLSFIDSDDFLDREMYERLLASACEHDAEIVCSGKRLYNSELRKIVRTEQLPVSMCDARQPRSAEQEGARLVPVCGVSVWNKLFSRAYIEREGFRFQEIERANDLAFVSLALLMAKRICFLREAYYCYRQGRVGGLQTGNSKTPLNFAKALQAVREGLESRGCYAACRVSFANLALSHARYNLLSQAQEESFCLLYERLHAELLRAFDIASLKEDEFLYPTDREIYTIIRDNASPYPLLLKLMKERNDRGAELMAQKAKGGQLQKDLAAAKAALGAARQEKDELKARLDSRKVRCSVVMAVYNAEEFLDEAVQSILDQDIGRENLQLVLVDDGSADRSGEICDGYAAKHPAVVTVIHQENAGVAAARNAGLKVALGKYVTFTDSDDKLTPPTCRLACDFLEAHADEIDMVAIPLRFFGATEGAHILNYKFARGTRVINLEKEWDCPQLSLSSAFTKTEKVRARLFDTRLAYAEDAKCALQILSEKRKLGVVSKALYLYRKRNDGTSAIQNSYSRVKWYLPPIRHFHAELVESFVGQGQPVPRFIQFALAYDLQWRIKQAQLPSAILSADECAEYRRTIASCLSRIDNDVIVAQRHMSRIFKFFALRLKLQASDPTGEAFAAFLAQSLARPWLSWSVLRWDFLDRTETGWRLEGSLELYAGVEYPAIKVRVTSGATTWDVPLAKVNRTVEALGETVAQTYAFVVDVPSDRLAPHDLTFALVCEDRVMPLTTATYGPFFPVSRRVPGSYCYAKGLKLSLGEKGRLIVKRCGLLRLLKAECVYLRNLRRIRDVAARKAFLARLVCWAVKPFKWRRLWLVSDRALQAGDNGEALFRYLARNPVRGVKVKFVIGKASPKFAELSKIGSVVSSFSYRHKIDHLLADCLISSQADGAVLCPMAKPEYYRSEQWGKRFVFLQHGITKDDLSRWLNRRNKNLSGFVTAARNEWKSVVEGKYDYPEDRVWLTGFPRFDLLESDPQKLILLMPTWRLTLTDHQDPVLGKWVLRNDFAETEFVRFYDGLINHPGLLQECARLGYHIKFVLHPNLNEGRAAFHLNDRVSFALPGESYADHFAHGSVLVTDYSSTAFDFAYLRKPVVYSQFDEAEFFSGSHSYEKGYFDYRRDGFGAVETTVDGVAERLIACLRADCRLDPVYRQRIDAFFAFDDRNNCARVLERICQLS